jgi:hypothetical protein
MIPADVGDLTPAWFSEILNAPVRGVQLLDAHSGTTGRARVGLTGSSDLPETWRCSTKVSGRSSMATPTAAICSSTRGAPVFYDWAVAGRAPGVRDVAYFLCNSLPVEARRAEDRSLLDRYRAALSERGVALDERTAHEQYRLFSVYSWIAAASTAAMGSQWQPIDVSLAAMVTTTEAIADLDAVGLLEQRLASG